MGMSMHENVSRFQWRQVVFVVDMSMAHIEGLSVDLHKSVICQHREFQYHLVYFRVAVSSYIIDAVLFFVQHLNHFFGRVFFRKIVSRTVIQKISKQDQTVCLLFFQSFHHFSAIVSRSVDI